MSLSNTLKSNLKLKKFVHRMLIPKNESRPRLWVKLFVNGFFHKKSRGSIIRTRTRIDVLPFNKFVLGKYSVIEDFCTINNGVGDVIIGENTLVGMSNVIIGPVSIGSNVILAQNVVVSGLNHEYRGIDVPISKQKITTAQVVIEDDCWIAANVVITPGVTIGQHCVIAAGSVVTKTVPSFSVSAGNPSKIIKQYNFEKQEWFKV